MQYLTLALPLAALALANPLERRGCAADSCLAAVTGKAALGDDSLRQSHCASFLATTVTPPAITVTSTVTGIPSSSGHVYPRASVTVCPNEVPNYASACDETGYTSACSCYGYTDIKTTTIAATTTTTLVYVDASCTAASTVTVTSAAATVTVASNATTVTVTVTGGVSTPTSCLSDADAESKVDAFINFLEHTSYNGTQGAPGSGYNYTLSAETLADNFTDISDSINFMAGFPLGSVTFASKAAFDYGQGILQPEVDVTTLNIWHDCSSITWRWRVVPRIPGAYPVTGINHMIVGSDGKLAKNYAEFDNGVWLQDFGQQCAINASAISVAPSPALRARANEAQLLRRNSRH